MWDVLTHAWEPVDEALSRHEWGTVASGGVTLAAGLTIGLAGLVTTTPGLPVGLHNATEGFGIVAPLAAECLFPVFSPAGRARRRAGCMPAGRKTWEENPLGLGRSAARAQVGQGRRSGQARASISPDRHTERHRRR
ncbi:hypothetical protein GCM10022206_38200 [Streptomyces chiangmaiensis]